MYFSDHIPRAYCLREITAAINASPSLANLHIDSYIWYQATGITPLQFFLQSRPELVQLELKHVPLPSAGIKEILSHKLQQLSISTPRRGIEFDWKRLWSALQEIRTALSILKVSGMANAMDEMFAYLLSYTGLQRLEIANMSSQEKENRASLIFWRKIIPHHRDSLTMLSIKCSFEGGWCYGPHAAPALWQCSLLRDLTIPVCRVKSSWAEATLSRARGHSKIEFHHLEEPDGAVENCGVRTDNGVS